MEKGYVIRQAQIHDLDEIASLEKLCFPEKEAASRTAFLERLSVYANHFWLLEKEGTIISMVNGMTTNHCDLKDEMYQNAALHEEEGKWQMIFGVETHPQYRNRGYAAILINKMIEDVKLRKRWGVVLTCKEHLIPYYERFGFKNEGFSGSEHGNAVWYQMRLMFDEFYGGQKDRCSD